MSMVLTVTVNPSYDTTATAVRVEPDRKIRCTEAVEHPGGGGINVARVIGILGGNATALWTNGGLFGIGLGQLLDSAGVDHIPIDISGHTRQSFAVIEDKTHRHYRFSTPGPDISEEELEDLAAVVRQNQYDFLVISGGLPPSVDPEFYNRLASIATGKGARVVLDTNGEPLRAALAGGDVYLVKPNFRELAEAVGMEPGDGNFDVTSSSRELVEQGKAAVVVTSLGPAGVILTTTKGVMRIPAPTVTISSKIGAGDSTVGGIVYRLGEGDDLIAAVRFGVASGAAAVMTPGTELCKRHDVESLIAAILADSDD
ncbi:MAG: 1-phosphofructokinase family hexose kinase [Acidimicrobiia bacterium]